MAEDVTIREYIDVQAAIMKQEHLHILDQQHQLRLTFEALLAEVDKRCIERFAHMSNTAALMDTNIAMRFAAIDKATEIASAAMDKRLDAMNELRAQLREQSSLFETKAEYAAAHTALEMVVARGADKINMLEQANANIQGRIWAMGVGITITSIIISVIIHFVH